jgi:hypothetical protein
MIDKSILLALVINQGVLINSEIFRALWSVLLIILSVYHHRPTFLHIRAFLIFFGTERQETLGHTRQQLISCLKPPHS